MKRKLSWSQLVAWALCVAGIGILAWSGAEIYKASLIKSTNGTSLTATSSSIPASVQVSEDVDTTKPTVDVLANYRTAPDVPRALYIDKLGIRARVVSVGIGSGNSMQTPKNIYDSGWYTGSAKLGTIGAVVIDGHASGSTRMGLFAYIDTLKFGDEIKVEQGDGTIFLYHVVHNQTSPMNDVDMSKAMQPYEGRSEGLTLITCTGKWLPAQHTYDHRVIVYAERVL
ncbi:MAG: class F sortase [Candidatus Saccharimonas sp.]